MLALWPDSCHEMEKSLIKTLGFGTISSLHSPIGSNVFWWIQLKKKSQTKSEHLEEWFRACHTQDLVKIRPLIQRHTLVQWGGHDRPQATCQGQLSRTNVFPRSLVCSDISHVWGLPTANWYQLGLSTYKTSQEANRISLDTLTKNLKHSAFSGKLFWGSWKKLLQRLNQNMAVRHRNKKTPSLPAPRDLKKLEALRSLSRGEGHGDCWVRPQKWFVFP